LGDINALTESISQVGLINQITVRKTDEGYKLLAGRRRLVAAKKLGWVKIPANVLPPEGYIQYFLKYLNEGDFDRACEICDYPLTEEHHIVPEEYGGADNEENKIFLCPNHHRIIQFLTNLDITFSDEYKEKRLMKDARKGEKILRKLRQIQEFDKQAEVYYREIIFPKLPHFATEKEIIEIAKERVESRRRRMNK